MKLLKLYLGITILCTTLSCLNGFGLPSRNLALGTPSQSVPECRACVENTTQKWCRSSAFGTCCLTNDNSPQCKGGDGSKCSNDSETFVDNAKYFTCPEDKNACGEQVFHMKSKDYTHYINVSTVPINGLCWYSVVRDSNEYNQLHFKTSLVRRDTSAELFKLTKKGIFEPVGTMYGNGENLIDLEKGESAFVLVRTLGSRPGRVNITITTRSKPISKTVVAVAFIVGIVVGTLCLCALTILVVCLIRRKLRQKKEIFDLKHCSNVQEICDDNLEKMCEFDFEGKKCVKATTDLNMEDVGHDKLGNANGKNRAIFDLTYFYVIYCLVRLTFLLRLRLIRHFYKRVESLHKIE